MTDRKQNRGITRRDFVATGAAAGTLLATGVGFGDQTPDLAVAHGPDVAKNTAAVIEKP